MLNIYQFICIATLIGFSSALNRLGYEYIEPVDGWLRMHVMPSNWSDARLRCHLEGGQLASPTHDALTGAMRTMMVARGLSLGRAFIGVHATISKGDFTTIEGTPLANIPLPWAAAEPDNKDDAEDCLAITSAGQLADVRCASALPYFCRKTNAKMVVNDCGTTADGYKRDPRTGSCYKFHRVPRTWRRAAGACAAERAHLAVINSHAESQVLRDLFAQNPPEALNNQARFKHIAHIGFWDWNERKDWLTIFGETFEEAGFAEWGQNEPNNAYNREFCGSVLRSGQLNDCDCDDHLAFICEITP